MNTGFARFRPDFETVARGVAVLNAEFLLLALYLTVSNHQVGAIRYLLYPFVWINVAGYAVLKTDPVAQSDRQRYAAAAVAAGYFLVVGYFGGLYGPAMDMPGMPSTGFSIGWLPPGWGPALLYGGEHVRLSLLPFKVVGYLGLAYLVYATILDAAGSAISGIVGLFSCVSCSWPIVASLVTGVAGAGSGLATTIASGSYDISTVVFVVTVALLYWRPTIR
ncbi:DUF7546 family protein [Halomicrococcus gelatinilyticus]|uniref:DUF7546 family protein n=1 Tax=Halomicrococcus gelatinilyticus TaxID=1702103 RepID=UPI002E0EA47A